MDEEVPERRGKYETTVLYVVQSLIVVAVVAGLGSGVNSRLNSAAINSLTVAFEGFQETLKGLVKSQHQTALINEKQTQQLIFMNEELKECKHDLKLLK